MSNELLLRGIGNALPFILIGWAVAAWLKRRRKADRLPRTPLVAGVVLGTLIAFSQAYIRNAPPSGGHSVEVMRAELPADGATPDDLTPEFVEESSKLILAELQKQVPDFEATPSSSIVVKNGVRLGVIRFRTESVVPWVSVMGIADQKLVRITCAVSTLADVDVNSPECSQALQKAFGTTIDG